MKRILIKYPLLKTTLFLLLLMLPLSTVIADDNTSRPVDQNSGKGLSNQIQLTEQEHAWLNRKHTVRVRINDFPPLIMNASNPQGIAADYLKLFEQRFGINFKFVVVPVPWKEAVEDLEGERKWCDLIVTIKRTPERAKKIVFTQDYLFAPWVIINRTNSPFVSRIEDLNNRSIAVERGYVVEGLIKDTYPQIKIVTVKNALEALYLVANGSTDAYVGNLTVASYLIQNKGLHNLKIAAPTPFGNHDQAMGVRSDWPELASIINKALMAMPEAEKSEITSRWFAVKYEYGITLKNIVSWVVGPIVTLSLIILVIVIWNRRLKQEIDRRVAAEKLLLEAKHKLTETLEFNETILNNSPLPMGVYEASGQCVLVNETYVQLAGASSERLLAQNFNKISAWQQSGLLDDCLQALADNAPRQREIHVHSSFGKEVWVECRVLPTLINGSKHLLMQFVDMSVRKNAERKLQASEQFIRTVLDSIPHHICVLSGKGEILAVNKAWRDFYDHNAPDLANHDYFIGNNYLDICLAAAGTGSDGALQMADAINKVNDNGGTFVLEYQCNSPTEKRIFLANVSRIYGDSGNLLITHENITKRKQAEQQIAHMAQHDTLTDLPNRNLFSNLLQHSLALAERDGNRAAMMFVDLDYFKPVNDTYGHAVGDLLLKDVAQRMREAVRSSDILGRIGGDEFVILLPKLEDAADAIQVGEKLRQALAHPFEITGNTLQISCSIGVSIYPDHGTNEKELTDHADQAMYEAKNKGRNCVVIFGNGTEMK